MEKNYNKNNIYGNNDNFKHNFGQKYHHNKNIIQNHNNGEKLYDSQSNELPNKNEKNYKFKYNNLIKNKINNNINNINQEDNNKLSFKYDNEEELNYEIDNFSLNNNKIKKNNITNLGNESKKELAPNKKHTNNDHKYESFKYNKLDNNQEYQKENKNNENPKIQNNNNKFDFIQNNTTEILNQENSNDNYLVDHKKLKVDEFLLKSYNQSEKNSDEIINELKEENLNLKSQNQILNVSLIQKEQLIDSLKGKISELENLLKNKNIKNNNNEYINLNEENFQSEINQLKMEKEELFEQNQKLILGINSFNERVKEINEIYDNKNKLFMNEIKSYKDKLFEYKRKIILLKRKIDELYNKRGKPQIISLFNYNKDYSKEIPKSNNLFQNKNLTPRLEKKNSFNYRRKRNESEGFIKFNIDNKENNLQNKERQFIHDYQLFLDNLGK